MHVSGGSNLLLLAFMAKAAFSQQFPIFSKTPLKWGF